MPKKNETRTESAHKSVLLKETIDGLNLENKPDAHSIIVDATFGGGGHSAEICSRYPSAKIIAFDRDKNSFKKKSADLKCDIVFFNENFRDMDKSIESIGIKEVDGIIFDLGLSSDQLDFSGRGFSFLRDEALFMTMKENPGRMDLTAMDVVNSWSEKNLADIIYGYGEEKFSRKIAKGIAEARQKSEIKTTFDLVKIIEAAVPGLYKRGKLHFATRTFQAIRIAVNDELGALAQGLEKGFKILKPKGRISVISFHSLEDRIVKKFFKAKEIEGEARLINKKVILPTDEEIKNNNRSRSGKLRILEKIL